MNIYTSNIDGYYFTSYKEISQWILEKNLSLSDTRLAYSVRAIREKLKSAGITQLFKQGSTRFCDSETAGAVWEVTKYKETTDERT